MGSQTRRSNAEAELVLLLGDGARLEGLGDLGEEGVEIEEETGARFLCEKRFYQDEGWCTCCQMEEGRRIGEVGFPGNLKSC